MGHVTDVPAVFMSNSAFTMAGSAPSPRALADDDASIAETQGTCGELVVITYNINSFMDFECRYEAFINELSSFHWDIIVFVETWRPEAHEIFSTPHGHTWFGSGGGDRSNGIGFLLHARWPYSAFNPVSQRVAYLDLNIHNAKYRIFGVYMPHTGREDIEVESVYAMLDSGLDGARRANMLSILAGDFNAEVGPKVTDDDARVIGPNASGRSRNSRGRWLIRWCHAQGLRLGNTFSAGGPEAIWTFEKNGSKTQLDYIMCDFSLAKKMRYCETEPDIDTGSAHRPVKARFSTSSPRNTRSNDWPKKWGLHVDVGLYGTKLEENISKLDFSEGTATEKAAQIEGCLRDSTKEASRKPEGRSATSPFDADIQACIQKRRDLVHESVLNVQERKQRKAQLSKDIKKLVRRKVDWAKEEKINKTVAEFRSLRRITETQTSRGKSCIAKMVGTDGAVYCSKEGIAEVFASFYESLYSNSSPAEAVRAGGDAIPWFLPSELEIAL